MRSDTVTRIGELWRDESGTTTVEYALLAALLAAVSVLAVSQLGESTHDLIEQDKSYYEYEGGQ